MYKSLLTSIDDNVVLMVMMIMVMAIDCRVLQVILPGGILMSGTALEGREYWCSQIRKSSCSE